MIDDPIVEEVHRWRAELLDEAGGDLQKLLANLKESEKGHEGRFVTLEDLEKADIRRQPVHS